MSLRHLPGHRYCVTLETALLRNGEVGTPGMRHRIEFVKEQLTFTSEDSPMANLLLSVMGAFAEFERALIYERQREGIVLAKQRGA